MVMKHEIVALNKEDDIVLARQEVRRLAVELGFRLIDQTKIVTASSELARNTVTHGNGGTMLIESLHEGVRRGLRLTFEDHGPGIPNIELALKDGYSSADGMGLGLSGSKRLMNEFEIASTVGEGTRVVVTRWR
jgi:serine/threonine-protein kinase RsbT